MTEFNDGLQNEEDSQNVNQDAMVDGADLATAEATTHEPTEDAQKVINRKHFQYHEERRKRKRLEAELAELKAKSESKEPPAVPEIPDTYDTDYAQKIAERDRAVAARAQWERQQEAAKTAEEERQRTQLEEQQKETAKLAQEFSQRAVSMGITAEETLEQQNAIIPFISHSPELANFLLAEQDGPALVKYLSNNVVELDKISSMSPVNAAVYLRTSVSPKAAKLVKKVGTSAPDPVDALGSGAGGATQTQSKFLEGVTFE